MKGPKFHINQEVVVHGKIGHIIEYYFNSPPNHWHDLQKHSFRYLIKMHKPNDGDFYELYESELIRNEEFLEDE